MRKTLLTFGLVALVAGCQAPLVQAPSALPTPGEAAALFAEQGRIAVTIRWPYRTQVIPTSTERLKFALSGPSSRTILIDRPTGSAPTSTASLPVDVGAGYTLAIDALAREFPGDSEPSLIVASGQSEPFDVLANKVTSVRVALAATSVPAITGFWPTNGGPGTFLTINGTGFVTSRHLPLGFRFGGVDAAVVQVSEEGTASALVPDTATTSALVPVADGVAGVSSGSFTVLSALGVAPGAWTVASGSSHLFTAAATTTEGTAYLAPTVQWALSTDSIGVIDQTGAFTATGPGVAEVRITSGKLVATASVTVP